MAKLTIMVGLPASGKSTKAEEILVESGNSVRVNKDLLRTMLHFDKWSVHNEKKTQKASRQLIEFFLQKGINVVVDDTNFNQKIVKGLSEIAHMNGHKFEIIRMDTPIEECIKRDEIREKKVGKSVIVGMAMKNDMYPIGKNEIVICDIDGTLANIDHRKHFITGQKDWKGFFSYMYADGLRMEVADRLEEHRKNNRKIFLVSGRPEDYRKETENWLDVHGIQYEALFMRNKGDSREDSIVKAEIFNTYFKNPEYIYEAIDDRPRIIVWTWIPILGKDKVIDVGRNDDFVEERKALNYYTKI